MKKMSKIALIIKMKNWLWNPLEITLNLKKKWKLLGNLTMILSLSTENSCRIYWHKMLSILQDIKEIISNP